MSQDGKHFAIRKFKGQNKVIGYDELMWRGVQEIGQRALKILKQNGETTLNVKLLTYIEANYHSKI